MSDSLTTFSFQDAKLRGALVKTQLSYQDLTQQHGDQADYPLFVRQLLGEMATLLHLMASNLKITGGMTLQIRGEGYLYSAIVDVKLGDQLHMRGLARRAEGEQPTSLDIRDWVGANATLAITLRPDQGQPYQGLIPLDHPRLSQCIEDYYTRSEQIPTRFWTQIADFFLPAEITRYTVMSLICAILHMHLIKSEYLKIKQWWSQSLSLGKLILVLKCEVNENSDIVLHILHGYYKISQEECQHATTSRRIP